MNKTVIAFYQASSSANNAAHDLVSHGFRRQDIRILNKRVPTGLRIDTFSSYGVPEPRARIYDQCVEHGVTLVTVNVPGAMVARAAELMVHSVPLTESEREHFFQDVFGEEIEPGKNLPGYGREVFFDLPPGSIIVEPPEPEDTDIPPGDPIIEPPDTDQPQPPPGRSSSGRT